MDPFLPRPLDQLDLTWPSDLDHISASSVKMAARCPEQWRQRYVLGRSTPPAAALLLGRADHAAIEHSMRQKVFSYTDLPVGEVKEKFVSSLDEELEKDGGIGELEIRVGKELLSGKTAKRKELSRLSKEGELLVGQYHTKYSPQLQPVYVEHPIELHVNLPVKVTGYIDLVAKAGEEQTIIDRKRTARAQVQPEWRIQAEIYQLAMPYPFSWHISQPGKGISVPQSPDDELIQQVGDPQRTVRFLEQVIAEVGLYYQRYGPEEPWPTRGKLHPWACGYCGFRPGCPGWTTTTKESR